MTAFPDTPLEFKCTVCGVRHGTPGCSPKPPVKS